MSHSFNRRDFLKTAGIFSGSLMLPSFLSAMPAAQAAKAGKQNILVVLFDTFSAYHISLYGYARETTPNLARLAERAVVYHNHFAAGNFTTPGTASLLTSTYPWTHRAFQKNEKVFDFLETKSLFHAFPDYYKIVYSHNPLVNRLFRQFQAEIDEDIPIERLLLTNDGLIQTLFRNDDDIASLSWMRVINKAENGGYAYSLFLPGLYTQSKSDQLEGLQQDFPRGLPRIRADNYFVLEQAVDLLSNQLRNCPRPFLGYFHLMPPHYPYKTRKDFYDRFKDDEYQPPSKPADVFGGIKRRPQRMANMRRPYDEFILYVDNEFKRFFNRLEEAGILEDTWVILTSDHGEMFERNIWGHITEVLYQPVIRVPLLIFEPGRKERLDVQTPTSAVDLLPTLLHLSGGQPADWSEGLVLPPFRDPTSPSERPVYALEAKKNDRNRSLTHASLMLVQWPYKLTSYFGYPELDSRERIELYDLEADPQELVNLYQPQAAPGNQLLEALKSKLDKVNQPYL